MSRNDNTTDQKRNQQKKSVEEVVTTLNTNNLTQPTCSSPDNTINSSTCREQQIRK